MLGWFFGWIFTLMWIDYTFFKGAVLPVVFKLTLALIVFVTAAWHIKKKTKTDQELLNQKKINEDYYNTLQRLKEQNQQ
tara:strand:- start:42 stop:278 length:237 start_codon:yes stop_codon:yes gene_type:complete